MRISDFKLAEHFLKGVCRSHGIKFVDIPVVLNDGEKVEFGYDIQLKSIVISGVKKLSQTLTAIIGSYIEDISSITGDASCNEIDIKSLFVDAASVSRAFCYSDSTLPHAVPDNGVLMNLRQFPLEWTALRDIVIPYYRNELVEIPVIFARSAFVDAARYVTKYEDIDPHKYAVPILLVNAEVEAAAVRSAYTFVEALRGHGLDASRVVRDLLGKEELRSHFYGLVKMALVDDKDVNEFFITLAIVSDHDESLSVLRKMHTNIWTKKAQTATGLSAAWLYPQLTESILGESRGADYSITNNLKPLTEELWNRVKKEKERRGKRDMTIEDLLRVQSQGSQPAPGLILQALLADERIW